jgi:ATP-dependent NAD(P)H-hydrate dehydratase
MSHVICEPGAAAVIKTYSPNLMIHPLLRQSVNASTIPMWDTASSLAKGIIDMLPRLHVLVVGPGLGRDELMLETCTLVLTEARKRNMPCVLDADALGIVSKTPDVVKGYKDCILTPNVVEFGRLAKAVGIAVEEDGEGCRALAKALGGVTIIRKGPKDWISDGEEIVVSDGPGGKKRSGGQGDTLTGTLGTWLAWRKAYLDRLWDHDGSLDEKETLRLAAFAGSSLTRECSRRAFEQKGRSLQASDLTEQVHPSFIDLFADNDEPGKHHS